MDASLLQQFPLLAKIENPNYLQAAAEIWENYAAACKWPTTEDAMLNINPVKGTLANYIRAVMEISCRSAETLQQIYGVPIDWDVLLLSAFLHDACKLLEYEPTQTGYAKSYLGQIYQHGFLSAHDCLQKDMPEAVISNILCHTPQTNHKIMSVEGQILAFADRMVTNALEAAAASA